MKSKRYVLARSGEAMPFRGRLFRREGEMMDPDDAFTRRLLAEGSIRQVEEPLPPDLGAMTKDELLAEADRRGIAVSPHDNKAELVAAIEGED